MGSSACMYGWMDVWMDVTFVARFVISGQICTKCVTNCLFQARASVSQVLFRYVNLPCHNLRLNFRVETSMFARHYSHMVLWVLGFAMHAGKTIHRMKQERLIWKTNCVSLIATCGLRN